MDSRNITALLIALVIAVSLLFGLVYFVQEGWPRLPPAVALIVWILLDKWDAQAKALYEQGDWPGLLAHARKWTEAAPDHTGTWENLPMPTMASGATKRPWKRRATQLKPDLRSLEQCGHSL